jgi:lipopolysaccharide transport system ATP-binding protein
MSDIAISVEHLYKQYKLGMVTTGTITHDLNRWWHKIQGKEDPYQLVTTVNNRSEKSDAEYVWALNNINFEVKKGEVLGIIGRNGAGKSTLLKVLSKVTSPTKGNIKVNGRIASLLEVGTGFHPELSGRENIYLNGAILGMTKQEIKIKFDEIVDFSGVNNYIDTPVKRYSSGMYVRLAFAVAAHLESEILIVDEVLAVGDAEFQKKCLGKMSEVSKGQGRTVLFVSHNMAAVKELCTKGVMLNHGALNFSGSAIQTVIEYQKGKNIDSSYFYNGDLNEAVGNENIKIKQFSVNPLIGDYLCIDSGALVSLHFYNKKSNINLDATFELRSVDEVVVFHTGSIITKNLDSKSGMYEVSFELPPYFLNAGSYYFKVIFGENQRYVLYENSSLVNFSVENKALGSNASITPGVVRPLFNFKNNYNG